MAERGFSALALTDHDSVDGVPEAMTAGRSLGVEVISGVELSVEFRHYRDVHLLGYLIDHKGEELARILEQFRKEREDRGVRIVERINARLRRGKLPPISYEEVRGQGKGSLGRPHIARILIARGYTETMEDAFQEYLIPCNVPKKYIGIVEAIGAIVRAGGVAVLAHPLTVTQDQGELRRIAAELKRAGLEGLEAYTAVTMGTGACTVARIAEELDLVATGGSDFHSAETLPFPGIDAAVVDRLRERTPTR